MDKCDKTSNSSSELGFYYNLKDEEPLERDSLESATFLAGKFNFLVKEYEVFEIIVDESK